MYCHLLYQLPSALPERANEGNAAHIQDLDFGLRPVLFIDGDFLHCVERGICAVYYSGSSQHIAAG